MNVVAQFPTQAPTITAPYKVDTSKGGHDGTVSRQWMSRPADQRFASLKSLYEFKLRIWEEAFESRVKSKEVDITAPQLVPMAGLVGDDLDQARLENRRRLHSLMVNVPVREGGDVQRIAEVAPTHYSFGQICQLAKAPARYLRELPSALVTPQLNFRLSHAREVEEVKLYGGDAQLYAATGPDYGRIPDCQVVEALRQIAGDGLGEDGFRWKTPGTLNWSNGTYDPEDIGDVGQRTFYASDRDMFVFLVDDRNPIEIGKLKDGSPDYVFRGFYIQNSEVGDRTMKLATFLLRGVCMNRNLWGVEGFEEVTIRHTRLAPDRWLQQVQPALASYAEGSARKIQEGVNQAKAAQVAKDEDDAFDFLLDYNLSKAQATEALNLHLEMEGHPVRSAWDAAQAITAIARDIPNTNDRMNLELEAGKILNKVAGR